MFHYRDQISLHLISGSGGDGCVSFHRTRKNPRGGPDGGDGGEGGSVVLVSTSRVNGFEHLKKIKSYKAEPGGVGGKQLKKGKRGKDLILNLPLGSVVRNSKGQILKDFSKAKKEVFLEGGKGGRGNTFFKTSFHQAPRKFQRGEKGKSQKVTIENKPLIHVGILGKVNTGKSSFFNQVTKARSPVASYPYTTLKPYIGQIKNFSSSCFVMDIPGLEKGASKSVFKGLSFLRSIQRARLLLHFIDSASDTALSDKKEIEEELKRFDKKYLDDYFGKLSHKKVFFILTKIDQLKEKKDWEKLAKKISLKKGQKIFPLSNKSKEGLKRILSAIEKEEVLS